MMRISPEILKVMSTWQVNRNQLVLPDQLDRKLYVEVNKVLEILGGKWDRKAKAHIFEGDPAEKIDEAMLTGEITDSKKEFNFFPTPTLLADKLAKMAEIEERHSVLEPSAGKGAIAWAVQRLFGKFPVCVEIDPMNALELIDKGMAVHVQDFLDFKQNFDRIVANPPFTRQQDVQHISYMYDLLNPGGVLVSMAGTGWTFRKNDLSIEFRKWLALKGAEITDVPEGVFKESGTMIRTCIIKIRKPK